MTAAEAFDAPLALLAWDEQCKKMDIQRVRGFVTEIATALEDPESTAAFDAILRRTGNYSL